MTHTLCKRSVALAALSGRMPEGMRTSDTSSSPGSEVPRPDGRSSVLSEGLSLRRILGILSVSIASGAAMEAAPARAQTIHQVDLVGFQFIPPNLTIEVGDTVHWVWISGFHNVESGEIVGGAGVHDGRFRSGAPSSIVGTTFDFAFDDAFLVATPADGNIYPYFCIVHAGLGMSGKVTVILRGDINRDGNVDLADHVILSMCLAGPDVGETPIGCAEEQSAESDTDDDGDVDMADFAEFQRAFGG